MCRIAVCFIIVWLMAAAPSGAGTIYTWTDKDGNKRFSNEPPPEGVTEYQVQTMPSSATSAETPGQNRRPEYDRMVEEAKAERRQLEQERKAAEAAKAAERKRQAELERQSRIDAQRKELEREIEAIRNRALSPTFSKGMQEAQIKAIQEQIDQLEASPEDQSPQKTESRKSTY